MAPSSEQYAQLAAMFTTSSDSSERASIELLLPAHLPVQGGLWIVPYAGREAQGGTSVLVRMHEDSMDVAIVGKEGNFDITTCTSIEEVIGHLDGQITNWIIQPPVDADPTSLLHCDADYVTLLSGADQAAVVGAYRLLKGLISATSEGVDLPSIRLVIVGAEERASSDAASRIVQTAHHQLDVNLEVGHPLPAMGSTSNVISQVTFTRSSNVVDFMGRLRTEIKENSTSTDLPLTPRFSSEETPKRVATVSNVPEEVISSVEPPMQEDSKPLVHTDNETSISSETLVSRIDGLLAITPRCPEHEQIELAVDRNGCLHILAFVDNFREASIVTAWATRNGSLLSMSCNGFQMDVSSAPVQHFFTNNAASVADLQASGVRLHLLTEVEVEGKTGVFCTPLN
jgi:hypothetical protein